MQQENIIRYYQTSQWLYRAFYYNDQSLGMHHGFWDANTRTIHEAILNVNDEVIAHGRIHKNMRILDAGCGVGGTAIHIAQKTGATVSGITLDPRQVVLARQYATKRNVHHHTSFSTQDYTHTNFPDNYFDVVYGIESICYASPKSIFLQEAYRVLKPDGKLIIIDGYLAHEPETEQERRITNDFKASFAMDEFITCKGLENEIKKTKFKSTHQYDRFEQVKPSVEYLYTFMHRLRYFCMAAKYIPVEFTRAIYRNYLAIMCEKSACDLGLVTYLIHVASKPR